VLQPELDRVPVAVRIYGIRCVSKCGAQTCRERATTLGATSQQIGLSERHCEVVIERQRKRGLEISDRVAKPEKADSRRSDVYG